MIRVHPRSRTCLVAAILAFVAGLTLVGIALPRAIAGLLLLPGEPDLRAVQDRQTAEAASLERIAASREAALDWHPSGRLWTDLALARLMLAERQALVRADRDLAPVRQALVRGLVAAPLNPYAWSRLAYIDYATGEAATRVAASLSAAILTGPSERRLYFLRAELGLRLWDTLDARDRPLVQRQLRLAWDGEPLRTLAMARDTGRLDLLRQALSGDDEAERRLDRLLARGF